METKSINGQSSQSSVAVSAVTVYKANNYCPGNMAGIKVMGYSYADPEWRSSRTSATVSYFKDWDQFKRCFRPNSWSWYDDVKVFFKDGRSWVEIEINFDDIK